MASFLAVIAIYQGWFWLFLLSLLCFNGVSFGNIVLKKFGFTKFEVFRARD